MSDLADPNRLVLAQRFLTAIRTNDDDQAIKMLSENVRYHVLGNHALAGTFEGPQAVVAHLLDIANLTSGRFDVIKVQDMMLGVQHVAVLMDVHMEAERKSTLGRQLILVRFDNSDLIDSVTVFVDDLDAAERFYGRR